MTKTFNEEKAAAAQTQYCNEERAPRYAPLDGRCYRCGANIYSCYSNGTEIRYGYSVEEAGERLITGCPFCHASFVD